MQRRPSWLAVCPHDAMGQPRLILKIRRALLSSGLASSLTSALGRPALPSQEQHCPHLAMVQMRIPGRLHSHLTRLRALHGITSQSAMRAAPSAHVELKACRARSVIRLGFLFLIAANTITTIVAMIIIVTMKITQSYSLSLSSSTPSSYQS